MKVCLFSVLAGVALSASGADFYVGADGLPGNPGTKESPWDLRTALSHPAQLKPGDTIWLRGGTYDTGWRVYQSKLEGVPWDPIRVRQYPGERVAIEGSLFQFSGGFTEYEGFEIRNSSANHTTTEEGPFPTTFQTTVDGQLVDMAVAGVDIRVPGIKLIHLAIHDHIGGGVGVSIEARDFEMAGCLVYYNGWQGGDRGHGHGIYAQSADSGTVAINDSVFYGNYALGIQSSGASSSTTDNIHARGNTVFLNGVLAREHQQNLLVGPFTGVANNLILEGNSVYDTQGSSSDVYLGYTGGLLNSTVTDNYFGTSVRFAPFQSGMTLAGNRFVAGTVQLDPAAYPANDYSVEKTNVVRVRPSGYETGRALVTIFNWQKLAEVEVDLDGILGVGTAYEVRNAQDFFGTPVHQGVYEGGKLSLPMNGLSVTTPVGAGTPPSTAPEFATFVVLPTTHNAPPAISPLARRTIASGSMSPPLGFSVSDRETASADLTVTASSSNPALLPISGIVFGGQGANRTVTLTPATGQSGRTEVRVSVSDGTNTAVAPFLVVVMPPPDLEAALMAHFAFDETTGVTFVDSSGVTGGGTLTTGAYHSPAPAHLLPGKVGPAAVFLNGDDDFGYGTGDYVTLGSAAEVNAGAWSFTLTGWLNTSTGSDAVLFNKYRNAGRESGYLLAVDGASNGGRLRLRISDGENNPNSLGAKTFTDVQPVNDGAWHHIAVVVDRANNETSFFVDGVLTSFHNRDNSGNLESQAVFGVGRANGAYGRWFRGAVDDARIYSRALWLIEIEELAGFTRPNTPPEISSLPDLQLMENSSSEPIPFQVSDLETPSQALVISVSSTNSTLLPVDRILVQGSGPSRTLTLQPNADQFGATRVTVTVNDGTLEASTSFNVVVSHVNRAPQVSSISDHIMIENSVSQPIGFIVSDLETPVADLAVTVTSTNANLISTDGIRVHGTGSNRTLELQPKANQVGATWITVTVSDGVLTASTSFAVVVLDVNHPPQISPIADQTIPENGASDIISFTVFDEETPPDNLRVFGESTNTVLLPPGGFEFGGWNASRSLRLYPAPGQTGTAFASIVVSDGTNQTSTGFVVEVTPGTSDPLPTPQLKVVGGSITLTWPSHPRVKLQSATSLLLSPWQDIPGTLGAGVTTLPCCDGTKFFRLARE